MAPAVRAAHAPGQTRTEGSTQYPRAFGREYYEGGRRCGEESTQYPRAFGREYCEGGRRCGEDSTQYPRAFGREYCVGWTPLRGVIYPVVSEVSSTTKLVARLESSVPVNRTVTVRPVKADMLKLRCT